MTNSPQQRWLFAGMAILGTVIFGYATGVLMGPYAPVLGERLGELTCYQLAFTAERASAILGTFSAAERAAIAHLLIPGDIVFAWGYGFLFTGLLGLLTLRLPPTWQQAGRFLMWTPMIASVLDCTEDLFLHSMAVAPTGTDFGITPLLASSAATLKYLALSVMAPAYGIGGSVQGLASDRRIGALVIYVLVVMLAVSMIGRPLQQAAACF